MNLLSRLNFAPAASSLPPPRQNKKHKKNEQFGFVNSTIYVFGGCEAVSACLTARAPGGGLRPGVVPNAQTLVAADNNVTMLLRPGYLDCGMPIVANRIDVGAGTGKREGERERE